MIAMSKNKDSISVKGRIDTITAPDLEKYLNENIDFAQNITLDLEKLEYISSAGLRVILSVKKKCSKAGGDIELVNVSDANMEIFEVTGFDSIISIRKKEN